jgi:hypothetical protein
MVRNCVEDIIKKHLGLFKGHGHSFSTYHVDGAIRKHVGIVDSHGHKCIHLPVDGTICTWFWLEVMVTIVYLPRGRCH